MQTFVNSHNRIILLYGCCVFFVWSFFSNILGFVLNSLVKELTLPYTLGGLIFSFSSIGFTLGAFIAGWVAERLLPKKVLFFSLLLFIAGVGMVLFSYNLYSILIPFFIIGLSGGGMITIMSSTISKMYKDHRSKSLNVLEIFFSVGAIATPVLINLINEKENWRLPYTIVFIAGIVLLASLWRIRIIPFSTVKILEQDNKFKNQSIQRENTKKNGYLSIVKPAFVLGLVVFFSAGGLEWGGAVWLPTLFEEERNFSQKVSRHLMIFLWGGFILSRVLAARFINRFDIDKLLLFVLPSATATIIITVIVDNEIVAIGGIFLFGLSLGCLFPAMLGRLIDLFPDSAVPITGAAMAIASLGSNVTPLGVGVLSDIIGMNAAIWVFPVLGIFGTTNYLLYLIIRKSGDGDRKNKNTNTSFFWF